MRDYQAEFGEWAAVCESYDSTYVPLNSEESRQEECSNWGNYAQFVFEQQGSYCQLG